MHTLDALDASILLERDATPEATVLEIARRLQISRNTVHSRLRRLRESGALGAPSSALLAQHIARPLVAFVTVSVAQQHIDGTVAALRAIPEVLEAHTITGDADMMLRVAAADTADLHRITQRIQLAPGVRRSSTSIATTEVVARRVVPLLERLRDQTTDRAPKPPSH
ncbi:Lrp/AsnC family transcriptional regulator [Arenivirga flava]|uniref:AsnC family transcriptional regulator n=1 Tax=Arenivirga flava TaxID=1930060 RepID=A0AA37XBI2_9MICO|nr:Lrp/AsnC family transcriptional regulator [Arenivirga flava]GMA28395.1 AsnC family transcriptional regulator [Arenivirga flava]